MPRRSILSAAERDSLTAIPVAIGQVGLWGDGLDQTVLGVVAVAGQQSTLC